MANTNLINMLIEHCNLSYEVAREIAQSLEFAENEYSRKNFKLAANYYRQLIKRVPFLKKLGVHNNLALAIILSVDWDEVSQILPDGINYLLSSGWINSLIHKKPVNQYSMAIPWYTYPAIEFIEDKIKRNFNVFEYGSGQSTFWWAERVNFIHSVEHNPIWIKPEIKMKFNIKISLCESEHDYAKEILKYPDNYFDCIIIDGLKRNQCAECCFKKVKQNGFIIFDNSDDKQNNSGIMFLMSKGFKRIDFYGLIPKLPYKGFTSIFFIDETVLYQGELPSVKQSCLGKTCCQVLE